MDIPPSPMVIRRHVDFSQTDAAGILHFSTYFIYMEAAEAALFRSLGLKLLWQEEGEGHGFPRVDCNCRFRRPVTFDSVVQIELTIEKLLAGRIHYGFRFLMESGELCAEGKMITVHAVRRHSGEMKATIIPDPLRKKLEDWKNQPA